MPWKNTDNLLRRRANQQGMGGILTAGLLCRQAEILYPGMFKAVSVRAGSLHVQMRPDQAIAFKMIEGPLLATLNQYGATHSLPKITRVRLTLDDASATL